VHMLAWNQAKLLRVLHQPKTCVGA
jgi:hypothetical protein